MNSHSTTFCGKVHVKMMFVYNMKIIKYSNSPIKGSFTFKMDTEGISGNTIIWVY